LTVPGTTTSLKREESKDSTLEDTDASMDMDAVWSPEGAFAKGDQESGIKLVKVWNDSREVIGDVIIAERDEVEDIEDDDENWALSV
jgi:hypothetical protein